jgi:hypothetical protein
MLSFVFGFVLGLSAGMLFARSNSSKVESAVEKVKAKAEDLKKNNK